MKSGREKYEIQKSYSNYWSSSYDDVSCTCGSSNDGGSSDGGDGGSSSGGSINVISREDVPEQEELS